MIGTFVGCGVGTEVGCEVGASLGCGVGGGDGIGVGIGDGIGVGDGLGKAVGMDEGRDEEENDRRLDRMGRVVEDGDETQAICEVWYVSLTEVHSTHIVFTPDVHIHAHSTRRHTHGRNHARGRLCWEVRMQGRGCCYA